MNSLILKKMFLLIAFISLTACNFSGNEKSNTPEISSYETNTAFEDTSVVSAKSTNEKIKPFIISDSKTGSEIYTIWYPSTWKRVTNSNQWTFEGPNNIKISREFGQFFTFGNSYGGQTQNHRPPMNINAIIDEFFMPNAHKYQRTLIQVYEVPKVAQIEHQYRTQLWTYAPTQKNTYSYAIEWKDLNNVKFITLLHVFIDSTQLGSSWGYYGQFLQANEPHFEAAKNAFINGFETKKYNQQAIIAYNNNEMQKANISDRAFQNRLTAINARTNSNTSVANIYSDILDISHSGYLSRSNMTSHGHSKTISGIRETVTVANHNTGEHYSVPMGSKNYWVSNQGTYFGTDNSLYNPNTDMNMNNKDWTKFEIEN
tara:strand:- start:5223 stop:6338 length:1116 start_codon:yes stop_codon:yes gene_type:complete